MPVRRSLLPRGPDILAYRRLQVGTLLDVNVLDTRQFRSPQVCGARITANCADALDPKRTMMGAAQERWLYDGFRESRARWTVVAQQVMLMRGDFDPDPNAVALSMDKWDSAPAARDRLFAAIEDARLGNVVVLTGDIHNNWAGELKKNFEDERSATLGVEFVGTSITSGGDGYDTNDGYRALLSQEPYMKFFNNQRGYLRHLVTPDRWQADFQVLDKVSAANARATTRRSFVVENGRPGLSDP
jgi:alkaline phosphatase D